MSNLTELEQLAQQIRIWGGELGFQQVSITGIALSEAERRLQDWLAKGWQGEMDYMAAHGRMRSRPAELIPGTLRVLSFRMDYLALGADSAKTLASPEKAYISRYALGRDYHKLIRKRLARLIRRIQDEPQGIGHSFRAFTDSAPVMEKALAESGGLGWIGKHTLLLNRSAGSWFFLGEIYTDLPLPMDPAAQTSHCGSCTACLDICPTQAITGPYQLDARRCISYLTIEHKSAIPVELRPLMGNRIFGCDDCQLVCPWNRFARNTREADFKPRHNLDDSQLIDLFAWTRAEFLERTAGSALRRAGYSGWLRNLAVALGNAPADISIISALQARLGDTSNLVDEHIHWALAEQKAKCDRQ